MHNLIAVNQALSRSKMRTAALETAPQRALRDFMVAVGKVSLYKVLAKGCFAKVFAFVSG